MTNYIITEIRRDIAPGEVFRHDGAVELQGNVGAGARIEITGGGFWVHGGNVGDNVTIIANGFTQFLYGITVGGMVGDNVTLRSDHKIVLDHGAGDGLLLRSGAEASISHVGDNANIAAKKSVSGGNIGRNSLVRAAGCQFNQLGHGAVAHSSSHMQLTTAGHDCRIIAETDVNAAAVGANSAVTAGKRAEVGIAHIFAKISGKHVSVRERRAEDEDFKLLGDDKWNAPPSAPGFPFKTEL